MLMPYMSHLGEGSWAAIKSGFLSVAAGAGAEPKEGSKALRYALQDIGFADFFVENATPDGPRERWMARLSHKPEDAGFAPDCTARRCPRSTPAPIS